LHDDGSNKKGICTGVSYGVLGPASGQYGIAGFYLYFLIAFADDSFSLLNNVYFILAYVLMQAYARFRRDFQLGAKPARRSDFIFFKIMPDSYPALTCAHILSYFAFLKSFLPNHWTSLFITLT
jgi:hypothetical protein